MLFQVLSDVHLEIYEKTPSIKEFITPKADVLILAGDVCHHYLKDRLFSFLKELCDSFKTVIYVNALDLESNRANRMLGLYCDHPGLQRLQQQVIDCPHERVHTVWGFALRARHKAAHLVFECRHCSVMVHSPLLV